MCLTISNRSLNKSSVNNLVQFIVAFDLLVKPQFKKNVTIKLMLHYLFAALDFYVSFYGTYEYILCVSFPTANSGIKI